MDDSNNRISDRLPAATPPPSIAILRLIVTALIIGACVFGGTVLFSASRIGAKVFDNPAVAWGHAGLSVLMILAQYVVLQKVRPIAGADEAADLKQFGTMTLTRIALLESAALCNYVVYLLTQNDVTLFAGVLPVLTMLFIRPSEAKFRRWRDAV